MIDLNNFKQGAIKDKSDIRRYRTDVIFGAVLLPDNFSVKDIALQTPIKNQGSSLSCGGQAFSKYIQILNFKNRGEIVEFSAKDIYQPVFLQGGGSRASDLINRVENEGVVYEKDIPSQPATEQFMETAQPRTQDQDTKAHDYSILNYVSFDSTNPDDIRQAIYQGNGAVVALLGNNACWQGSPIEVPAQGTTTWGHFLVLTGWQKRTDGKYNFEAVNSWSTDWGDAGFCIIPQEYFQAGYGYNEWILTEIKAGQYTLMMKLITLYKNLINLLLKK